RPMRWYDERRDVEGVRRHGLSRGAVIPGSCGPRGRVLPRSRFPARRAPMSGLLRTGVRVWRALVPRAVRESPLARKVRGLTYRLLGVDPHDILYDSEYFRRMIEGSAVRSAEAIADSILSDLAPRTVVDVGCGTGALLEVF